MLSVSVAVRRDKERCVVFACDGGVFVDELTLTWIPQGTDVRTGHAINAVVVCRLLSEIGRSLSTLARQTQCLGPTAACYSSVLYSHQTIFYDHFVIQVMQCFWVRVFVF